MFGSITKYKANIGVGVIVAEDGRKYRFTGDEIVNPNGRVVGHEVDFEVTGIARPREIVLMAGSPWNAFPGKRTAPDGR